MNSLKSSSESVKSIVVDGIKPEKFMPSKFDIAIGKLESSNKHAIEVEDVSYKRTLSNTNLRPHMEARSEKSARS